MNFRLGELFCGPGGLAAGAFNAKTSNQIEDFKIYHEWSADYDMDSCETYRHNFCRENPDTCLQFDVHDIENYWDKLKGIDAFAYGFPCNDFSIVGEHKGFTGKYGPLYSYGVEVLNRYKPKFFVAENVSGMSSANQGDAFKRILNDLSEAGNGYDIVPHKYKFEEYNVPQTRHRIIIVGIDKQLGLKFKVPRTTTKHNHPSAGSAIESPPIKKNAQNNELTKQHPRVVQRLEFIKEGENAWTANLPLELELNVPNARLSHIYKRLTKNKPAYTVTGSGGGGTHVYHWKEPRALTNRERARLQTFDDSFVFKGTKESVRKQIGMAVPPRGAEQIFEAILKTFAGIPYDGVPQNINLTINQNVQRKLI